MRAIKYMYIPYLEHQELNWKELNNIIIKSIKNIQKVENYNINKSRKNAINGDMKTKQNEANRFRISCQEFSLVLLSLILLPSPLPPVHCLHLFVSLLSAFSCFACSGYKRGVDYKIMKIYGSPSKASRWMERKGYAICRAFRELCPWPVMKMAKQRWQLPGTLSTLSAAFSYLLSFFPSILLAPPLQVYLLYRRNQIDTPISLILSSLFTTSSLGNEAFYMIFTQNKIIFELH